MASFYQCLLLTGLCALIHCHPLPEIHAHHDHSSEEDSSGSKAFPSWKLAQDNADVAFKYYHYLDSKAAGKNIFFSPISVSIAFAMLSLGARSATLCRHFSELGFDPTKLSEQKKNEGILNLLHVLNRTETKLQMNIGNAIFTDDKVQELQQFLDYAEKLYQNFPTHSKRSVEAEDLTNITNNIYGKLANHIKDLDPEFVMLFLNSVFRNAYMNNPFYDQPTQEENFTVDDVTTEKVKMMNKASCYNIYSDKELGCEVVQIPYKSNASALFILPERGQMRQVEEALGEDCIKKWQRSLSPRRLVLSLPRLSQSTDWDIRDILISDQSGIPRKAEHEMSKAIHDAVLVVHEDGMLGQTGVQPVWLSSLLPFFCVVFNRPFLEVIVNENNLLFIGRIMRPN